MYYLQIGHQDSGLSYWTCVDNFPFSTNLKSYALATNFVFDWYTSRYTRSTKYKKMCFVSLGLILIIYSFYRFYFVGPRGYNIVSSGLAKIYIIYIWLATLHNFIGPIHPIFCSCYTRYWFNGL